MINLKKYTKFLEKMYTDTCTISEYKKYTKENKSTGHKETVVLENQPCRLSYVNIQSAAEGTLASTAEQKAKLFIAPDTDIKPGSKITVQKNGRTLEFSNSGEPALYDTHQEIMLEKFRKWT